MSAPGSLHLLGGTVDEAVQHINRIIRLAAPFDVTLVREKHLEGGQVAAVGAWTFHVSHEVFDRLTNPTPEEAA
jgi:hypothetical protein